MSQSLSQTFLALTRNNTDLEWLQGALAPLGQVVGAGTSSLDELLDRAGEIKGVVGGNLREPALLVGLKTVLHPLIVWLLATQVFDVMSMA